MRKLPIGIQGFEKLIREGFVYVDKTEYIYRLAGGSGMYFLSRPRRFGKSLLLAAMKAYWLGKKELFHGLRIEELEKDNPDAWKHYPVFHFDFNGESYLNKASLKNIIDEHLRRFEKSYAVEDGKGTLGERFRRLLSEAKRQTGLGCVVLVDEYDKPLLEVMENPELEEYNKAIFKGFFSTLKGYDEYLRFVFITGVTKFEKVSIFSDLNQLEDISFDADYAGICGITEEEAGENFQPEIARLAAERGLSEEDCRKRLENTYDGYRFSPSSDLRVYNPFSLLNALKKRDFAYYWFSTGTPTFLVKRLRRDTFDVRRLTDKTIHADEGRISDYRASDPDPVPLLYQTGYLTIADYDERRGRCTLAFPNDEVKYGFLDCLVPEYAPAATSWKGADIFTLDEHVENGNLDGIRDVFTALFASITYTTNDAPFEHYFQTVFYLVFTLLGRFVDCETHTYTGRVDCVLETDKYVYLFEFKRDGTAEEALRQIGEMRYADIYAADPRKLFKIGAAFDSKKRALKDWKAL